VGSDSYRKKFVVFGLKFVNFWFEVFGLSFLVPIAIGSGLKFFVSAFFD
jgi:hypothetical protein